MTVVLFQDMNTWRDSGHGTVSVIIADLRNHKSTLGKFQTDNFNRTNR